MDHELQCLVRNPSAEAIHKFEKRISQQGSSWTVGMAETLLAAIPKSRRLWYLLAKVDWDDHVLYAVQQHLARLTEDALEQQAAEQGGLAMVGVVRMWEALERLRSFSSPLQVDTLWIYSHVEPQKLHRMAQVAVDIVASCSSSSMSITADGLPAVDPDTVCNASVSFLALLLQHDVKEWLLDMDDTSRLTNHLEHEANRLQNNVLPSPAAVGLALSCVGLLCLLRWKLGEEMPNHASLMTSVCKVAFLSHSNSPSGPQWTYGPVAADIRPCALSLLQIWSLTGETLPEHCWSHFLLDTWAAVLEARGANLLPSLLFLHSTCRLPTRKALYFVLGRKDLIESCRTLVAALMNHCQQKDIGLAASSAALLRTLLRDRRNTIMNDDLSRSMWSSLDVFPIEKLLDGIITLATSDITSKRACQPLIIGMMDVLELLASYPEGNRTALLENHTERIESLIEIMSIRPGYNNDLNLSIEEMEDHTPPANNLSRLDESHLSFMVEQSDDESAHPPTGLDDMIRITVATILVHMCAGATNSMESNAAVWRTRVRTAVMDFVTSIRLHGHTQVSADMKQRLFRLQVMLATSSNDIADILSCSVIEEELLCRQERHDNAQQLLECHRQLEEARIQVKQLEVEQKRYRKAMRLQAAAFDREVERSKSKATLEATQLVEVHGAERRAAENRAEACVRRAKHVEELQREAENRIEEYKTLEARAKEELQEIETKLEATRDELNKQRALTDEQKQRSADHIKELSNCQDRLQIVEREHKSTRSHLVASQAALNETKTAYNKLHDDLEETFSQLSLLAQVYQAKEEEITRIVEKKDRAIHEARRSADTERRRNDELEANQRTLQYENERLTKKYQRAKDKLEEERNERQKESQQRKQRGPVSYINNLHDTSTSSRASKAIRAIEDPSRHERRARGGLDKENGHRSSLRREGSYNSHSSIRREYR